MFLRRATDRPTVPAHCLVAWRSLDIATARKSRLVHPLAADPMSLWTSASLLTLIPDLLQVQSIPPGGVLLASSPNTPVEMFAIGRRVLAIQGHPEFSDDIVESIIEELLRTGIITVSATVVITMRVWCSLSTCHSRERRYDEGNQPVAINAVDEVRVMYCLWNGCKYACIKVLFCTILSTPYSEYYTSHHNEIVVLIK